MKRDRLHYLVMYNCKPIFVFSLFLSCLFAQGQQEESTVVPIPDELSLAESIEYMLANNFVIRQAKERIRERDGFIVEASASGKPDLSLNYQYQREDTSLLERFGGGDPNDDQNWSINLEVRQSLYAGGANKALISEQKKRREAAMLDLQAVINEQLFALRSQYYLLLLNKEKIAVQEAFFTLRQEQLEDVRKRYEAGTVSRFEKLQAEVAVANARPPLIRSRNDLRIAAEEFRELLGYTGRSPETVSKLPTLTGTLQYEEREVELWTSLEMARINRPELLSISLLSEALEAVIRKREAAWKPTLGAVARYEVRKSSIASELNDTIDGWVVGVQGSWAIFDARETKGKVIQAKSQYEQNQLALYEAQLRVDVEVRRAFSAWQEAKELVSASGSVIEQAEEALRLAKSRFSVGTATQLDILQAQVELTQAATNRIEALYSYNVALAQLDKAIGRR